MSPRTMMPPLREQWAQPVVDVHAELAIDRLGRARLMCVPSIVTSNIVDALHLRDVAVNIDGLPQRPVG